MSNIDPALYQQLISEVGDFSKKSGRNSTPQQVAAWNATGNGTYWTETQNIGNITSGMNNPTMAQIQAYARQLYPSFDTLSSENQQAILEVANVQLNAQNNIPGWAYRPTAVGELPVRATLPSLAIPGQTPAPGAGNPANPNNPANQTTDPAQQNALDMVLAANPWIAKLGLQTDLMHWVTSGLSSDAIVQELRGTTQWKTMFPGIRNPDGTMKMNESTYQNQEQTYKQILQAAGVHLQNQDDPQNYVGFFQGNVDPNELQQRATVYNQVQESGKFVQDAFYVYAGLNVNTDTLYNAVMDPNAAQALTDKYNAAVAANPLDYQTWITRATEVGLQNVATTLGQLQAQGQNTGSAITALQSVDPTFAKQMMDLLYHGGNPTGGDYLNLDALQRAFAYSMIGSAATMNGLQLPSGDLLQQIRAAGVTQADAQKQFGAYGQTQNYLSGAAARSGQGTFTQQDFEQATFLHQSAAQQKLDAIQAEEKSLSKDNTIGGFRQEPRIGLLQQPGFGPIGA